MLYMKQMKSLAIFSLFVCFAGSLQAQLFKPKFGLRAGGNVTTILGDKEEGLTESYGTATRISIAATMTLPLHERFGLSTELAFSQRGASYSSSTENSYLKLPSYANSNPTKYTGYKRTYDVNIINGYVEIPVLGYVELIKDKLKLDLGASIGFLVSSSSLGTLKYGEAQYIDAETPDLSKFIEMNLTNNYLNQDIGETPVTSGSRAVKLDGTSRTYPSEIGAYYLNDYTEKESTNTFKTVDFGLQAGLSYNLTQGLLIGSRVYYGLTDITNTRYDFSQLELNSDGSYKTLEHKDSNFGISFFVGLQF
jgi:hypothetical protein